MSSIASLRHLRPGRVCAGRLDAAGIRGGVSRRRRTLSAGARQAGERSAVSRGDGSDRQSAPGPMARWSSSTIAPTSRGWRRPAAFTSARTICRPTLVRTHRGIRGGRRPVDAHGRSVGRGARPAGELRGGRPGVRDATRKRPATSRSASRGATRRPSDRGVSGARTAARRHRRHHARQRALGHRGGRPGGRRHLRSPGHRRSGRSRRAVPAGLTRGVVNRRACFGQHGYKHQ